MRTTTNTRRWPKIIVPAYGNPDVWSPRLEQLIYSLKKHNDDTLISIVTDQESRNKWSDKQFHNLHVFTSLDADSMLTYSNLNMSGILLAEAAAYLSPCLILTIDCQVVKPIDFSVFNKDFMIGKDPGARQWNVSNDNEEDNIVLEHNVAVAYFNDRNIGKLFLDLWRRYGSQKKVPWWEQVIWSAAYKEYSGSKGLYPDEYNWSHWWLPTGTMPRSKESNEEAIIIHYHGQAGSNLLYGHDSPR